MKTRTVTVTLEVETDAKLGDLRKSALWSCIAPALDLSIKQVHVTVIDATKGRHNATYRGKKCSG